MQLRYEKSFVNLGGFSSIERKSTTMRTNQYWDFVVILRCKALIELFSLCAS